MTPLTSISYRHIYHTPWLIQIVNPARNRLGYLVLEARGPLQGTTLQVPPNSHHLKFEWVAYISLLYYIPISFTFNHHFRIEHSDIFRVHSSHSQWIADLRPWWSSQCVWIRRETRFRARMVVTAQQLQQILYMCDCACAKPFGLWRFMMVFHQHHLGSTIMMVYDGSKNHGVQNGFSSIADLSRMNME